jgi:hypothetical protein
MLSNGGQLAGKIKTDMETKRINAAAATTTVFFFPRHTHREGRGGEESNKTTRYKRG